MSIYKELSADQEIRVVTGIQFTIMSPEDIKRRSVAEIETSESFKGTEPKLNGLFDPRMGVIENGQICKTCEQKTTFCPGHFGHIQLAKPVFYHQFYDTIRKILKCVCFRCSALLKEPEELLEKRVVTKKASRQKRFESIYKALTKQTSTKTCNRCGSKQPDIKREPGGHFTLTWSNDDANAGSDEVVVPVVAPVATADGVKPEETTTVQIYYAEDVLPILQRISEIDAEFMGFSNTLNRPEWMICTVFPVPPPTVRPSVRTDTGQRAEDDLTHKLCDIVKTNNTIKLKIEKGVTAKELQPYIDTLQLHVFHFVDNKIPGVLPAKHRTGRPFRVLRERLKGKEGRIRGNLMGKRVDFSARSVITPDPNISIDELGVPTKIAMNITVPETVNETNKTRMLELVRAGPTVYPGAKYLHKARENRKIILKSVDRSTIELEEGDVLDRHLANGDYVLFNRQPSLHKMSMMGHRVRVMPYDTFRVNVCVTKPYNADFDGDEMNAFIPQSIQTENELIMLAAVPTQIISPGKSSPIIAVVQDVALGIYRITKPNVRITEKQMFNLIMTNSRFKGLPPAALPSAEGAIQRWSGRQLLSMAIPTNVNIFRENDKGEDVEIVEGQIVSGTLSANDYQAATTGLVHTVFNENGPDATRELFDNTQRLICDWLVQSGFSVGISDLIMDTATNDKIQQIIHKAKVDSYALIHKIHMRTFTNDTINNNEVKFEEDISEILSKANSEISSMATKYFSDDSRMINMIRSGSKGKDINVSQMTAFLAQQSIEGNRIEYGFTDRTLPHYNRYDDGPESRGFVENSFLKGLTPQEFFYHSMAGREGLIDTAVRTSTTGYIQRKLIKAMEDCKIHHDLTVRNATGCIIQYLYGEDGMNATKLEKQSLPYADSSKTLPDIEKMYLISLKDELKYSVTDAVYDEFYKTADWGDRCKEHYKKVLEDRNYMINDVFRRNGLKNSVNFPVCFPRIIRNTKTLFKTNIARIPSDLNPLDVIDRLDEMEHDMRLVKHSYGTPIRLFGILLRAYLSPKRLIMEYGFGKLAFENMIVTIKQRFYGGIAHPSEMVGVVSAQSIGEPATQLVLNSVEWDTELLLKKTVAGAEPVLVRTTIGGFADNLLSTLPTDKIEVHGKDQNMELGWIDKDPAVRWDILSSNTKGQIGWNQVEAVTRHPVVNLDGSDTILRVTLESGRQVTATKAKSFLKRVNNEIVGVNGDTLKVGDYLPVSKVLPIGFTMTHWDVSMYLPKTEWFYKSEAVKALAVREEYSVKSNHRNWYNSNHGKRFTLPYSRSDAFTEGVVGSKNKKTGERAPPRRSYKDERENCIYPKSSTFQSAHIPERIELDADCGFFVGAYLAEGCCTEHHLLISNIDDDFNERIDRFCKRYELNYHIDDKMVVKPGYQGRSKTLRTHSMVLTQLFIRSIGTGAGVKRIPAELFAAPDEFLKGLIDGYFSGDGCVPADGNCVMASSICKGLLEDIQQVLTKFGVMCNIRSNHSGLKYALAKGLNAHLGYNLYIGAGYLYRYRDNFKFTIKSKQERLDKKVVKENYFNTQLIPDIVTEKWGTISLKERDIKKYMKRSEANDKAVFQAVLDQNIIYDKIKKIEEVTSVWDRVYDLTVEGTRNFGINNGINCADTFHSSGQAQATKTVRGVPRLNELLSVSKSIKTPSMTVYLNHPESASSEKVDIVGTMIQTTYIQDIIKSSAIYYSPSDINTDIEDDKKFIEMYRIFDDITPEMDVNMSPWLIRLEFNKEKMNNLHVTMADIHLTLIRRHDDKTIHCMFSDDNADKLIFRIKPKSNSDDVLTDLKVLERSILEKLIIKGIEGVRKVEKRPAADHLTYNPDTQQYEKQFEYFLITDGSNLRDALCIPEVDKIRTITNDVHEVYKVLGIEAARQVLLDELVACLSEVCPEYRHISLLVDVMTNKGTLFSIDRHGINRSDIGPLAKCSFEETSEMLIKAGMFAEYDPINGVSANIMLGQIPPCGTGDTTIIIDEAKLLEIEPPATTAALTDMSWADEMDACDSGNLEFNFRLPTVIPAAAKQGTSTDIVLNVL